MLIELCLCCLSNRKESGKAREGGEKRTFFFVFGYVIQYVAFLCAEEFEYARPEKNGTILAGKQPSSCEGDPPHDCDDFTDVVGVGIFSVPLFKQQSNLLFLRHPLPLVYVNLGSPVYEGYCIAFIHLAMGFTMDGDLSHSTEITFP